MMMRSELEAPLLSIERSALDAEGNEQMLYQLHALSSGDVTLRYLTNDGGEGSRRFDSPERCSTWLQAEARRYEVLRSITPFLQGLVDDISLELRKEPAPPSPVFVNAAEAIAAQIDRASRSSINIEHGDAVLAASGNGEDTLEGAVNSWISGRGGNLTDVSRFDIAEASDHLGLSGDLAVRFRELAWARCGNIEATPCGVV